MMSRFIVAAALLLTAMPHSAGQLYSSSFRYFPGVIGKGAPVWNIAQGTDCSAARGDVLQDFTASELLRLTPASTTYKQAFLSQVSQADIIEKVVALNPFFTSTGQLAVNPVVDKNRFRPVLQDGACSVSFSGVSAAHPVNCEASYSTARDDSSTFDAKWSLKLGLTILGANPSEFSVNYVRTEQQSAATSNKAAIHLETSSPSACVDGQLLVDTMFNTYAVLGNTHTCP